MIYFLQVHGFTFLVPQAPEADDTDMVRTVARWMGYDMEWVKTFTPYAQVSSLRWQTEHRGLKVPPNILVEEFSSVVRSYQSITSNYSLDGMPKQSYFHFDLLVVHLTVFVR